MRMVRRRDQTYQHERLTEVAAAAGSALGCVEDDGCDGASAMSGGAPLTVEAVAPVVLAATVLAVMFFWLA